MPLVGRFFSMNVVSLINYVIFNLELNNRGSTAPRRFQSACIDRCQTLDCQQNNLIGISNWKCPVNSINKEQNSTANKKKTNTQIYWKTTQQWRNRKPAFQFQICQSPSAPCNGFLKWRRERLIKFSLYVRAGVLS